MSDTGNRQDRDEESTVVEPYRPGSHECCCGNPECTDFEDRMAAWGIPLDEITTVTSTRKLGKR